ncbi:hypothetical protein BCR37DRAFT_206263 [Protomyces lactucae-debilis]|uniref:FH2 domain-containing protein n=1 Tax=Protomyces lactucae-debilis TaxID=2754530 RepID=A0A1Y2FSL0_PROLT|nr:uncharacterized protein BCR37DRAFT_206263 [Protomyces lactucae-debilis]ORY86176.1 hypothetical protein BCR37DRAFT_206263 [Protomyces lactucae-debilis]
MPVLNTMSVQKLKKRTALSLGLSEMSASETVQYAWSVTPETDDLAALQHIKVSVDCRLKPAFVMDDELDCRVDAFIQHVVSRPASAHSGTSPRRPATAKSVVSQGGYPIIKDRPQSMSLLAPAITKGSTIKSQHAVIQDPLDATNSGTWHRRVLSVGEKGLSGIPSLVSTLKRRSIQNSPERPGTSAGQESLPGRNLRVEENPLRENTAPSFRQDFTADTFARRGRSPVKTQAAFIPNLEPACRQDASWPSPTGSRSSSPNRKSRSKSPVRLNMSHCPPTLEWDRPASPLKQQLTGNSWLTSWWTRGNNASKKDSPRFHLNRLEAKNQTLKGTHRDLVDLRVQLGTSPDFWLVEFIAEGGLVCFAKLLDRARIADIEASASACLEIVKCVRVLLNTTPGFDAVIKTPDLICSLCWLARDGSLKCQTITNDLLSGLCVCSPTLGTDIIEVELGKTGHRSTRFDWLTQAQAVASDDLDLLRSRAQLINALTNCWHTAEDRVVFRRLLGREKVMSYSTAAKLSEEIKSQLEFWLSFADEDAAELRRLLAEESLRTFEKAVLTPDTAKQETEDSPCRSSAPSGTAPQARQLTARFEAAKTERALPAIPTGEEDEELCVLKDQVSEMRELVQTLRQELAVQKEENLQKLQTKLPEMRTSATLSTTEVRSIMRPVARHQRPKSMSSLEQIQSGPQSSVSPSPPRQARAPSPLRKELFVPRSKKENLLPVASLRAPPIRPLQIRQPLRVLSNVSEHSQEAEQPLDAVAKEQLATPATEVAPIIDDKQEAPLTSDVAPSTPEKAVTASAIEPQTIITVPTQKSSNSTISTSKVLPPPPPSPGMLLLSRNTPPNAHGTRHRGASPSKPLKPLFWDKLSASHVGDGTIWSEVAATKTLDDVHESMKSDIQRFFAKDTAPGQRSGPSAFAKPVVKRHISLIDLTRAKNMEIVLARIRLQPEELRHAILQMDENKLCNSDYLRTLMDVVPTVEDIAAVNAYDGDVAMLGTAEKHILALGSIDHLKERLGAMAFRQRFDLDVAELLPDLDTMRHACREVYDSQILKDMLTLALSAGNILNASTFRGGAQGFKLGSLLKLSEIKSTSMSKCGATLLHYLVAVHEKKIKGRVDFETAIPHCAAASRGMPSRGTWPKLTDSIQQVPARGRCAA